MQGLARVGAGGGGLGLDSARCSAPRFQLTNPSIEGLLCVEHLETQDQTAPQSQHGEEGIYRMKPLRGGMSHPSQAQDPGFRNSNPSPHPTPGNWKWGLLVAKMTKIVWMGGVHGLVQSSQPS